MIIEVAIQNLTTNQILEKEYSINELIEFCGEDNLVDDLIECNCSPIGESYAEECQCYDNWNMHKINYREVKLDENC